MILSLVARPVRGSLLELEMGHRIEKFSSKISTIQRTSIHPISQPLSKARLPPPFQNRINTSVVPEHDGKGLTSPRISNLTTFTSRPLTRRTSTFHLHTIGAIESF